jgi:Phosphotriesterase family
MAAVIRTIRGDIDPAGLGPCDAHEHLFLVTPAQPGEEYSDVSKAIEEAKTLRAAGGRALVDWTPIGLGRDLNGLRAVSEATGLHIVAATGVHRDVHYAADDTLRSESEDTLANRFVGDLERCGIIKVGAGYHTITPFESKERIPGADRAAPRQLPSGLHARRDVAANEALYDISVRHLPALCPEPAQAAAHAPRLHARSSPRRSRHPLGARSGRWLDRGDGPRSQPGARVVPDARVARRRPELGPP